MRIELEIIPYHLNTGIKLKWIDGYYIIAESDSDGFIIKANASGLVSLAMHLLTLAQVDTPVGTHIHLDRFNSLEDESCSITIEKMK